MHLNKSLLLVFPLALVGGVRAQITIAPVFPTVPVHRSLDLLVGDQSFDGVWRMIDWDQDGTFNGPGEVIPFYDSSVGAVALGTPTCIAVDSVGTAYVTDLTADTILALRDGNSDGDAHDVGEYRVFFDTSNASGIGCWSIQGICIDVLDRVFITNADNGQGGVDAVYVLQDLNGDGDAQDVGEIQEYYRPLPQGGATAASNPFGLLATPDGDVYYCDNGVNGAITKGIYQLHDADFNGVIDATEATLYWAPPAGGTPFLGAFALDQNGDMFIAEYTVSKTVYQLVPGPGAPSQVNPYWTETGSSTWFGMAFDEDNSLFLGYGSGTYNILNVPSGTPAYASATAAVPGARTRSMAFLPAAQLVASPAVVGLGQQTMFEVTTAKPNEIAAVILALGLGGPFEIPPFGRAELDPTVFIVLGFGISDPFGHFAQPFTVPNNPAYLGTLAAQAWAGDAFRIQFSNATVLTIQ